MEPVKHYVKQRHFNHNSDINGASGMIHKTKTFNHNGDINRTSGMLCKTKKFIHNV